ncbi:hypothetical protein LXT21_12995 [Myxococcus sp. K38C18041901]|uniref:hypothetical protein n=1 Tax=Myxococcus guangdongensis TaxID=2906760 RepID=UPI0020A706E0|nr:hypothetical protein [Myxococcus guangdongensis]MCP3059697.1 hypothetical protein [Myxococcus guangdongensis]
MAVALGLALATGCGESAPTPPLVPSWTEAFDATDAGWLMNVSAPPGGALLTVGGRLDQGGLHQRQARDWAPVPLTESVPLLNWSHGFAEDDRWVVGNAGTVLHGDGVRWRRVEVPTDQDLWGIWGAAPDALWVVGGRGRQAGDATLLHYDGREWTVVAVPPLRRERVDAFYKVWGSARDDVWVVGQKGAVLHWDGAAWTEHFVGLGDDLICVWGTGRDRVVVVGGRSNGVVARWNGQTWDSRELAPLPGLNGVWMRAPEVAHVVGIEGTLAVLDVDTLTVQSEPATTRLTFHGVFGDASGQLTAVGGNLGALADDYRGLAWTRPLGPHE